MSIHYVLGAHANNCNCGWHINKIWISGWLLCENSDNYNKLDAKGRGSIDKCQSKMSVWQEKCPLDTCKVSLQLFRFSSNWYCCRDIELNCSSSVCHLWLDAVSFRAHSGQIAPYGPLLWARESRNIKLILCAEGLNLPGLYRHQSWWNFIHLRLPPLYT